jgi:hypothetical protein
MPDSMSLEKCRQVLGESAENMTDAEIEAILADFRLAGNSLHSQMSAALASGTATLGEWRDVALMDSDTIPPWLNTDPEQAKHDAIERMKWLSHLMDTGEGE